MSKAQAINNDSFQNALKELRNLKVELMESADYAEASYLKSERKDVELSNIKDYSAEMILKVSEKINMVADRFTDKLDRQCLLIADVEARVTSTSQRIECFKQYLERDGLNQYKKEKSNSKSKSIPIRLHSSYPPSSSSSSFPSTSSYNDFKLNQSNHSNQTNQTNRNSESNRTTHSKHVNPSDQISQTNQIDPNNRTNQSNQSNQNNETNQADQTNRIILLAENFDFMKKDFKSVNKQEMYYFPRDLTQNSPFQKTFITQNEKVKHTKNSSENSEYYAYNDVSLYFNGKINEENLPIHQMEEKFTKKKNPKLLQHLFSRSQKKNSNLEKK